MKEMEICPHCGLDVCNGMGSAEMPLATKILNRFPMAGFFERECNMHDMDYHLQRGFKRSNDRFLTRMRARALVHKYKGWSLTKSIKRTWYRNLAYAIHWFVTGKNGLEAYRKGKCKKLPKRARKSV
jgi:hypothetical protein